MDHHLCDSADEQQPARGLPAVLLFFSGQVISPGCLFFHLHLSFLFKNVPSSVHGLQLFLEICTVAGMVEVHPGLVLADVSAIPRAKLQINTWKIKSLFAQTCCYLSGGNLENQTRVT